MGQLATSSVAAPGETSLQQVVQVQVLSLVKHMPAKKGMIMISRTIAACLVASFATASFAQQSGLNESHLNALDKDGDGAISQSEFSDFTVFAFKKMDTDGDGALSPDEVDDHVVGDAFKILDDDGDGSVSEAEFSKQMQEDFSTADKDGDGQLN